MLAVAGTAQSNAVKYDLRRFNLGFMAGVNIPFVRLGYGGLFRPQYPTPGVLTYMELRQTPGINLGMITNLRLARNWDLRFLPAISLQERQFDYIFTSSSGADSLYSRTLEAAFVDMPLVVKFKSDLYQNYRVYVMFGAKYSRNLISDRRARDNPNLIRIDQNDLSLEFAFGLDLYTDRVKLCPEIRYSMGLLDLYLPQYSRFSAAINRIVTHSILLCINFE